MKMNQLRMCIVSFTYFIRRFLQSLKFTISRSLFHPWTCFHHETNLRILGLFAGKKLSSLKLLQLHCRNSLLVELKSVIIGRLAVGTKQSEEAGGSRPFKLSTRLAFWQALSSFALSKVCRHSPSGSTYIISERWRQFIRPALSCASHVSNNWIVDCLVRGDSKSKHAWWFPQCNLNQMNLFHMRSMFIRHAGHFLEKLGHLWFRT